MARFIRRPSAQFVDLRLEQEGIESAAVIDALERPRRDAESATERSSVSEISVTLHRFGRKRRLVLRLEWLTLWRPEPIWP